jgi:hypothetical protein
MIGRGGRGKTKGAAKRRESSQGRQAANRRRSSGRGAATQDGVKAGDEAGSLELS